MRTRWMDIADKLMEHGYTVYPPGQKKGECTSPYLVVKDGGYTKHPSFSTNIDLYEVLIYLPREHYSQVESEVLKVQEVMKELSPMVTQYGTRSPIYFDDEFKAYTTGIMYKNYKKI